MAFIDKLEKQVLKKQLKWANKKCKRFNIYSVVFFWNETKKNTRRYHYFKPVYQKFLWYDLPFLKYRVWQTQIGNYGHFLFSLASPRKTPKIRILKKWKKLLEISSFYICAPKTTIMWGTVSEICCGTDITFGLFGPFFSPFFRTIDPTN